MVDPTSATVEAVTSAFDLRNALRNGAAAGAAMILISVMGIVEVFDDRMLIYPVLSLGYAMLFAIPVIVGYVTGRLPPALEGMAEPESRPKDALGGLIAGAVAGGLLSLLVIVASLVNMREVFINISPTLLELLTFGLGTAAGLLVLMIISAALGAVGSAVHLMPAGWRKALVRSIAWVVALALLEDVVEQLLRGLRLPFISKLLYAPTGGLRIVWALAIFSVLFVVQVLLHIRRPAMFDKYSNLPDSGKRRVRLGGIGVGFILLAAFPLVSGPYLSEILNLVGIFLLMGLGLNIVVGFSGLLDLGYVAFFAVGAYATAVLTSPSSPAFAPGLTFWTSLPFILLAAAFAGVLIAAPVLRMRGDYLAIVTLGFGEIARLLAQSDWLKPSLGGAQGILRIPAISIAGIQFNTPPLLFYIIAGFCLLAVFISWRVQDSRIGRGWMAVREDEDVAEAMGVNIVSIKILAFVTGAIIASFAGAIFAAKVGSVFPHSFKLIFSITVLVVIIVGGLASLRGVVIGALVIIAVPELLREFDEYRELFYGILLVLMMRLRPQGLLPSLRRARELKEEEEGQDVWTDLGAETTEPSSVGEKTVEPSAAD